MTKTRDAVPRYYIGLATTFHEPAVAIVDPEGQVVFAEATERLLQDKRALDQRADPFLKMPELLQRFCHPEAELIVATSWSRIFSSFLGLGATFRRFDFNALRRRPMTRNRSLLPEFHFTASGALIHAAQRGAGLAVLNGAHEAFGHRRVRIERYDHHLTHAAHACLTSPFESAVCAIVDGMGEFGSLAFYFYEAGRLHRLTRHLGLESLGFFYALVTELCGFHYGLGEEWKVMGLASYGERDPVLEELLRRLCHVNAGRLRVPGKKEIQRIVETIGRRVRPLGNDPFQAADLARAGQTVFAENMTALLRTLAERGLSENLVLAGGCALNSAYNGCVLAETGFCRLYVPAAPADDGNAVGAALLAYGKRQGRQPWTPGQHGPFYPYVGSPLSPETIARVEPQGLAGRVRRLSQGLEEEVARLLERGRIVGWVRGRAEFGPRALGNRSILADPRDPGMKDRLNQTVKFREAFRPFAPAILDDHGPDYFEGYQHAPYMERVQHFRPEMKERVPAVVHIDGTGRVQSVTRQRNPHFHALIKAFARRTGVPLLLNTSCNVMGRPIAHSVEDTLGLFFTSGLDVLVIEDLLIEK